MTYTKADPSHILVHSNKLLLLNLQVVLVLVRQDAFPNLPAHNPSSLYLIFPAATLKEPKAHA